MDPTLQKRCDEAVPVPLDPRALQYAKDLFAEARRRAVLIAEEEKRAGAEGEVKDSVIQ